MAKASYVQITPGLEPLYQKALQPGDRYVFSRVIRKHSFVSRQRKSQLQRSQMVAECAAIWAGFDQTTRDAWIAAAAVNGQRGYSLFVQDQVFRIKYGIPGEATPNLYHQYKVGRIVIQAPSDAIKIAQYHPASYYVSRKVSGTKTQYQPVLVEEIFSLPLTIGINYESNLTSAGGSPSAKFYAEVYHNYQGVTRTTLLECELDLSSEWTHIEATLSSVIGVAIGYNLFIEIIDCTGELQFDNVQAVHDLTNWARGDKCTQIDMAFTRAFYQVPRYWVPVIISDDAFFDSVYPT